MRRKIKLRAVLNLLAIVICLILIYFLIGSPAFTAKTAYKRAEQANLVGPGTILGVLEPAGQEYSQLVVARDHYGVMLYAWDLFNPELREFVYLQSGESLILAAAPGREYFWLQPAATLPVLLFDQTPKAVLAEAELTIAGKFEEEAYRCTYALRANRENDGYFLFKIHTDNAKGAEGHALFQLRNATGNSCADMTTTRISAHIRLFDEEGQILEERTITL